jgi:hypothetical protein
MHHSRLYTAVNKIYHSKLANLQFFIYMIPFLMRVKA